MLTPTERDELMAIEAENDERLAALAFRGVSLDLDKLVLARVELKLDMLLEVLEVDGDQVRLRFQRARAAEWAQLLENIDAQVARAKLLAPNN